MFFQPFRTIKNLIWGRASWIFIGIFLTALLISVTRAPSPANSNPKAHLELLEMKSLPLYVFSSWLRMLSAYILSLIFAVLVGTLAATKEVRAKILLPILDVLQSIPVLGFFPTAIYWFVKAGGGSHWGVELAVVFLIFTSQSWNLVFGVYDGIKAIPAESTEALRSLGIGPLGLFRRLYLPAALPRLVYNSVLSWANGWYFLMACEIIAMGPLSYKVSGLGSFLSSAIERKDWIALGAGLSALILVIALMSLFLWKPLEALSAQFKFESTKMEGSEGSTGARVLALYRNRRIFSPFRKALALLWRVWDKFERFAETPTQEGFQENFSWRWVSTLLLALFWFAVGTLGGYAGFGLLKALVPPWEMNPMVVLASVGVSLVRITGAWLLSLLWILPLVYFLHQRPKAMRVLNSSSQILASLPATALFPLIMLAAQRFLPSNEWAVLLLLLTGMQWYLLFNVISGANSLPNDIREASKVMGLKRGLYLRRVFFPCIFPALITGSITAVGGGWNALIISEYFVLNDKIYSVFGVGSVLAQATYVSANSRLLSLALFFMVAVIVLFNRFFWQPLYRWSEKKYRLEG